MRLYPILLLAVILPALVSCKKQRKGRFEDLFFLKQPFEGGIRIDGYYYEVPAMYGDAKGLSLIRFFYMNGTALDIGSRDLSQQQVNVKFESYMLAQPRWGAFVIKGNSIQLTYWQTRFGHYPAVLASGTVLNDTTYVIEKELVKDNGKVKEYQVNDTFRFVQYDKPDSTNGLEYVK